ncbi:MAG TPA: phosphoribosylanthranilate isomerase [Balneolales bacterium]|nr:phosphoribosylanthranilate isomerase [Balneolales bacterium]
MFVEEDARTRVKICGLTKLEHARYASGAMADYLGYIFYDKSPRYIVPAEASAIISWVEGPQNVGVFVDQSLDDVNEIATMTGIDYIQLHGEESPEYCQLIEKPIIKSFRIKAGTTREELEAMIAPYEGVAEYFLFDTYDKDAQGGTGKKFNWEILKDWDNEIPFFLAGGLSSDNISKAIRTVKPYAIDISSSLEAEAGIKDLDKMDNFFEEVRRIWDTQEAD